MAEKSLAVAHDNISNVAVIPAWTSAREQLIRDNFVPRNAPNDMVEAFLALARHRGLAPEEKHIYLIERGGKWTVQTGIDGFRLIADRTGVYAGSDPATYEYDEDGALLSATVVVWKFVQGQRCAFGHTAFFEEYRQAKSPVWSSMPRVMLAKCAESGALRKAFPAQLAGIYVPEEMDQADATTGEIRVVETGNDAVKRDLGKQIGELGKQLGMSKAEIAAFVGTPFPKATVDELEDALERLLAEANRPDAPVDIDPETGDAIPEHILKQPAMAGMASPRGDVHGR